MLGTGEIFLILMVLGPPAVALFLLFRRNMPEYTRLLWVLIILAVPFFGAALYLFSGEKPGPSK